MFVTVGRVFCHACTSMMILWQDQDSHTCAVVEVFHDIAKIIITKVSTSMTINRASQKCFRQGWPTRGIHRNGMLLSYRVGFCIHRKIIIGWRKHVSALHWHRCHSSNGRDTPMICWHMDRPIKFKWAGPTKGPQDFVDHNGLAQLKAHKILWAISHSARQLDTMLLGPLPKGPLSNSAWY